MYPKIENPRPRLTMTRKMTRIRRRLQELRRNTPIDKRDAWYYETHEELSAKLAHEKQGQDLEHIGCDTWLPPWDQECKIYE